jgi:hypothetical protein
MIGAIVIIVVLIVIFGASKRNMDDTYAANAIAAKAQDKTPVEPITGNTGREALFFTIVIIVVGLGFAMVVGSIINQVVPLVPQH